MARPSLMSFSGPRRALIVFGVAILLGFFGALHAKAQTPSDSGMSARFVRADGSESTRMRRPETTTASTPRCHDSSCASAEATSRSESARPERREGSPERTARREEPRREGTGAQRTESRTETRTARRERPRTETSSQERERPSFSFGTRVSDARERRTPETSTRERRTSEPRAREQRRSEPERRGTDREQR